MRALYPRYCAACGKLNMVSINTLYGGEVCDASCWRVFELRKIRATLGEDFDLEADIATCAENGVVSL